MPGDGRHPVLLCGKRRPPCAILLVKLARNAAVRTYSKLRCCRSPSESCLVCARSHLLGCPAICRSESSRQGWRGQNRVHIYYWVDSSCLQEHAAEWTAFDEACELLHYHDEEDHEHEGEEAHAPGEEHDHGDDHEVTHCAANQVSTLPVP